MLLLIVAVYWFILLVFVGFVRSVVFDGDQPVADKGSVEVAVESVEVGKHVFKELAKCAVGAEKVGILTMMFSKVTNYCFTVTFNYYEAA